MSLERAIATIVECLESGGTLYACGNGGSHAHADHLVAELVGRFAYDRPPLRAVLLSSGGAVGSCIANDYGWSEVFARQVQALVYTDDVLVVFTTSGKSKNVRRAIDVAFIEYARVVVVTGPHGVPDWDGDEDWCPADVDYPPWTPGHEPGREVVVRSRATTTPEIQEDHMRWVHAIAKAVEEAMCPR